MLTLLAVEGALAAPTLMWDPVTTGTDGQPLGSGLDVSEYRVYTCGTSIPGCATAPKVSVGMVIAPAVQFDLSGQPVPTVYVVTAVNKVGESTASLPFKVVPPDMPKNLKLP